MVNICELADPSINIKNMKQFTPHDKNIIWNLFEKGYSVIEIRKLLRKSKLYLEQKELNKRNRLLAA